MVTSSVTTDIVCDGCIDGVAALVVAGCVDWVSCCGSIINVYVSIEVGIIWIDVEAISVSNAGSPLPVHWRLKMVNWLIGFDVWLVPLTPVQLRYGLPAAFCCSTVQLVLLALVHETFVRPPVRTAVGEIEIEPAGLSATQAPAEQMLPEAAQLATVVT